ncbi:MAG: chemotaxis protein CheV [Gammaproteobacteria bacterium]|nr:MAG: chemotaxis protein CheV [Gammaproteobacteria bacterium]
MASLLDTVDQRTRLAGQNRLELLLFRLQGRQRFAINVFKVQEVIQCPPLSQIPESHSVICGISRLRGKTIPILDLSYAVGMPAAKDIGNSLAIITEYNRKVQGFLVAGVDRIINKEWAQIHEPPRGTGQDNYVTAVTEFDNELIEIIDVEKVLVDVTGQQAELSEDIIEQNASRDLSRFRLLVVDDSAVARNQIIRTLDQLGIRNTIAGNGLEGLNILKAWARQGPIGEYVDMVVSDIEMPEMDGYTLTTEIRKDPQLKGLHILLHTSMSGVFNMAMVEKVGANKFVPKFNADELGLAIIDYLKNSIELP